MFYPNSSIDDKKVLDALGIKQFEELLGRLPRGHVSPGLGLPKSLPEIELTRRLEATADGNATPLSFLGAGAYDHFVAAAVPALANRSEFATAYTPYQPEASQGTLQTLFEFQSIVAEIYGMDVANASLYDGAHALAEAARLAVHHTGRAIVILPDALHPHYKRTLQTVFLEQETLKLVTVGCPDGTMNIKDLESKLNAHKDNVAAVIVQNPNFFGCLENGPVIAEKTHGSGALLIVSANPLSLGLLSPPGDYGADIATGEGQPLGLPVSFGGPYLGLFSCKKELIRKSPGRFCGKTIDLDGKTGYVLTLQAREQHIRREKATSNICTNQNLCATAFTINASLLGPEGLQELAEVNLQMSHYAADELCRVSGYRLKFSAPFFNEFVLETSMAAETLHKKLLDRGILAGLSLAPYFSTLDHHLLINVTERRTKADIDRFVSVLRSIK